ncbi:PREDICTED: uncharacterized protein LOC108778781 isoform X1 [Cyphomyrmex costatus]|uniref:uncharacterized protein LOC108778781 isoform X1 n=1 Tax=Cyphomyrmex costatus TaxID=456900 RepID=UPI0008522C9F|nr:PREDICTED: uncharacterized protein LOC108778781 isoform X1 [Cyphomyrmex costatus]
MKFLDPYIAQRRGESSITEKFPKHESECSTINELINEDDTDNLQLLDVHNVVKDKEYDKENICENIHSSSSMSSISSQSRTATFAKRKKSEIAKTNSFDVTNNFWSKASTAIESISQNKEAEDGLKHWILYVEDELRKIKNLKKLKGMIRYKVQAGTLVANSMLQKDSPVAKNLRVKDSL